MFKHHKFLVKGGLALFIVALLLVVPIVSAFAASPGGGGQPNQSCPGIPLAPLAQPSIRME